MGDLDERSYQAFRRHGEKIGQEIEEDAQAGNEDTYKDIDKLDDVMARQRDKTQQIVMIREVYEITEEECRYDLEELYRLVIAP